MGLENQFIHETLLAKFGDSVSDFNQIHDILTFEAEPAAIKEVIQFLKSEPSLNFNFLTDLCGVHYPEASEDRQFAVVYHMHNWFENVRIRIKCFLSGAQPEIPTVSDLFRSANWQERETYDFYGIRFMGHPQLKRILNMDEMTVFPLRKEYPLEDGGRTDKDDRFFGRTTDNC